MTSGARLAAYTVVLGEGYCLPETVEDAGVDYICFTDRPEIDLKGWTPRLVEPVLPMDRPRSSRDFKMRPHRLFPDHEASLYIDASVQLLETPWRLWERLMPREEILIGLMEHSERLTLFDEFRAVAAAGFDDWVTLASQYFAYQAMSPTLLDSKPLWGGVLARRHHHADVIHVMEMWWAHCLRYSRRDQLSLPVVLSTLSFERQHRLPENHGCSKHHRWPRSGYSRPASYRRDVPSVQAQVRQARALQQVFRLRSVRWAQCLQLLNALRRVWQKAVCAQFRRNS